ncbi:hypothetical protein JCM8097_007520 [Rhodosporidiobolus ruineniae]
MLDAPEGAARAMVAKQLAEARGQEGSGESPTPARPNASTSPFSAIGRCWLATYLPVATLLSHAVPFGGYKQSGWGRDLGSEGLDGYLETKAVETYYGEAFERPSKL